MKRSIKFLLIGLLMIAAMCLCCSCNQNNEHRLGIMKSDKRAIKIMDIIDEKLADADSYTMTTNMEMFTEYSGVGIWVDASMSGKIQGQGTDTPLYRKDYVYEYTVEGVDETTTASIIEGYNDGYMYRSYYNGVDMIELKSPVSAEDYFLHIAELSGDLNITMNKDMAKTLDSKKEDGFWVVTASNLNREIIEEYERSMGDEFLCSGFRIKDINVSLTVKEDFSEYTVNLDFKFENKTNDGESTDAPDRLPVVCIVINCSSFDETVVRPEYIVSYKEVCDLRLLDKANKAIGDLKYAADGSFTLAEDSTIQLSDDVTEHSASSTVTYGERDGDLFYEIITSIPGKDDSVISYKEGMKNANGSVRPSTYAQERTYINGIIDYGQFNHFNVIDIQPVEGSDNSFVFSLVVTESLKEGLNLGKGKWISGTYEITLTFDGDSIIGYETHIMARYNIHTSAYGYIYVSSYTCTVNSFAEFE